RNCPRLAGKGAGRWRGYTEDRVGSQINQFFCEGLYPIRISGAPAKFDPKIAAIGPSQLRERTPECREVRLHSRIALRIARQHADPPYLLGLLRPRDQRPPSRRAADQRDELAPPHWAYPSDHAPKYSRSGACIAAKAARWSPVGVILGH